MPTETPSVVSTVKIVLSKFIINEDVSIYEMEIVGKSHTYKAYITESMYKTMKGNSEAKSNERGEFVVLE